MTNGGRMLNGGQMTNGGTNEGWGMDNEPRPQQTMNAGRRTMTMINTPTHDERGDDDNDPQMGTSQQSTTTMNYDHNCPREHWGSRQQGGRAFYFI